MRLCTKYFSHPSLVIYLCGNPTHKIETAYTWETTSSTQYVANHLEQSLQLAYQKTGASSSQIIFIAVLSFFSFFWAGAQFLLRLLPASANKQTVQILLLGQNHFPELNQCIFLTFSLHMIVLYRVT
jgi:hypothetical protein